MLLCLSCVDYTEYFQMVYVLQSLEPERTLVLRTDIPYSDASVPSVTPVWRAANWYEREAHDLFGVDFDCSRFRTLCLNRELGIVLFFIIDSHLVFLKVRVTFIDNGTFLAPLPLALKALLE